MQVRICRFYANGHRAPVAFWKVSCSYTNFKEAQTEAKRLRDVSRATQLLGDRVVILRQLYVLKSVLPSHSTTVSSLIQGPGIGELRVRCEHGRNFRGQHGSVASTVNLIVIDVIYIWPLLMSHFISVYFIFKFTNSL